MAGLLPRLQQGGLPGSEAWIYLDPIVPGSHPLESLALALAKRLPDRSLLSIRQDLEEDSARGLHQLATTLTHSQGTKVLLCVDQFEELFTQTSCSRRAGTVPGAVSHCAGRTPRSGHRDPDPACGLLRPRAEFLCLRPAR